MSFPFQSIQVKSVVDEPRRRLRRAPLILMPPAICIAPSENP
jgi:hypothetical protein